MKIWKYEIKERQMYQVEIPKDAEILSFQMMQDDKKYIWCLVDPDNENERRTFTVFGTGEDINPSTQRKYIGTIQEGPFVWHLFEDL